MKRVVLTRAPLPPSALAELKQWLGVTTAADDAALAGLIAAALETCEAFTGIMPLRQTCEEVLEAAQCWQVLATRPVTAIVAVDRIGADGARDPLPSAGYAIELESDGSGRVRLLTADEGLLAVRFEAGLAQDWDDLAEGLRHGVIRLAAHQHREREGSGAAPLPPASVAAMWRPWRRMRLA